MGVTPPSTCPWLDHSVSGLTHATYRPIKTRFRYAYTYRLKLAAYAKSLTHYTKGTKSQHEAAPSACRHSVSGAISLPLSGFFSPFPHGTCSLSVTREYLALSRGRDGFTRSFTCIALLRVLLGSSLIHTGFLVPRTTRDSASILQLHTIVTGKPIGRAHV